MLCCMGGLGKRYIAVLRRVGFACRVVGEGRECRAREGAIAGIERSIALISDELPGPVVLKTVRQTAVTLLILQAAHRIVSVIEPPSRASGEGVLQPRDPVEGVGRTVIGASVVTQGPLRPVAA